jgi:uncharacterized OsmC-like protein
MSVIDTSLQERLTRRVESLRDARELKPGRPSVETETLHNYHARAHTNGFSFDADEPESKVGGTGRGPRPLRYFLAGFAFCLQAQYARNAMLMGVELGGLAVDVEGEIDRLGGLGLRDRPADFERIEYTTSVESDADRAQVAELRRRAESCCYVHGTLDRAVPLEGTTTLNGTPL